MVFPTKLSAGNPAFVRGLGAMEYDYFGKNADSVTNPEWLAVRR